MRLSHLWYIKGRLDVKSSLVHFKVLLEVKSSLVHFEDFFEVKSSLVHIKVLPEVKFMQRHPPACKNNANLNVDKRKTFKFKYVDQLRD